MSTKPGVTTRPPASMVRAASSSTPPRATTRPSRMPTSARRRGAPVPSTTLPPTIFTSSTVVPPLPRDRRGPDAPSGYRRPRLAVLASRRRDDPDVLTPKPSLHPGDDVGRELLGGPELRVELGAEVAILARFRQHPRRADQV